MSRTGAARLAARAGLRVGAGLVTVLSPPDALMVNAINLEAVMVRPFGSADALAEAAQGARAAVIGPGTGVGRRTVEHVAALRQAGCALVLDADAITSFAGEPQTLFELLDDRDVLTPHEGEFERLWPRLLDEGRLQAAHQAARDSGAVILLKGPETLIAHPDGRMVRNHDAPPWLATAGSGDVLAGLIGGLIAQGVDAFDAACMAAWIHAEIATRFGPGLIAEDLPDSLPSVLSRLYEMGRAP